jgi:hypothetical protein
VVGDARRLVAAYVADRDPDDVRHRVAEAAGLTLRHVHAVRLPAFPRRPNGKIDVDALRVHLRDPGLEPDGLLDAYRTVFFPRHVDGGDSFESLGGDSLRHVELAMLLERRLGRVPAGWERKSVTELMALGRAPQGRATTVGMDHVIRALAILLVVIQHETLWPVPGGAAAMIVLIGFGLARFQKEALIAGDFARHFRPLGRVLIPYGVILAGYALAWQHVPWASVLLVSNFGIGDPADHTRLPFLYWFVEAYAQMLVVFAGLFLVPAVRRLATADPFRLGLAVLAGSLVVRVVGPKLWPLGGPDIFTLPWVFHLAALGWCAATADTPSRRRLVLGLAIAIMPAMAWLGGNWTGSWVKFSLQIVVIAALVAVPRITLPSRAASAVLGLAAASYHVYLVHRFVPELLLAPLDEQVAPWVSSILSIAGGIALGVAVFWLNASILQRIAAARRTGAYLPGMPPSERPTPAKLIW